MLFVKEQIAFQEKMARRYDTEPWRRDLHLANVSKLIALLNDLEKAETDIAKLEASLARMTPTLQSITLTPDDLDGLPDELIRELSISDADKQEFSIVGIINDGGGILSLDKIMIGIFRKTGEVVRRTATISRLYRMAQKGLIYSVPMKKGFYATRPTNEQDIRRIFGPEDGEEIEKKNEQIT